MEHHEKGPSQETAHDGHRERHRLTDADQHKQQQRCTVDIPEGVLQSKATVQQSGGLPTDLTLPMSKTMNWITRRAQGSHPIDLA